MKSPSLDRDWTLDQKLLPYSIFSEEEIHIYNIRNITYRNTSDYDVYHYNKTVNISEIQSLYYFVEDLGMFPGFSHTMLSFGFKNGDYIAFSVEIRKKKGDVYGPIKGLFRTYELMYVIADERDVINLRANYRNSTVYSYPINISNENLEKLFISMLERTNNLNKTPEFYNTLTSTCTTNLVEHANLIENHIFFKYHPYILLPGFSDKLLLKRNLINSDIDNIKDLRNEFKINDKAKKAKYYPNFSKIIRS